MPQQKRKTTRKPASKKPATKRPTKAQMEEMRKHRQQLWAVVLLSLIHISMHEEYVLVHTVDLDEVPITRSKVPFLMDRRQATYTLLTKEYGNQ